MPNEILDAWFRKQARLIDDAWDNISLYTGEEGTGKSNTMLQFNRLLDPKFDLSRVHFTQDTFLAQIPTLPEGSAIMLDEFRGHRRAAMHGERLEFLDMLKEVRGLRLHMSIGFPHVVQIDRDILRSRIRNWLHHEERGVVTIRERHSQTVALPNGEDPKVVVRWPVYGRFRVGRNKGPLQDSYEVAKDAHMRRSREARGQAVEVAKPKVEIPPAVMEEVLAKRVRRSGPPSSGDYKWVDLAQRELSR